MKRHKSYKYPLLFLLAAALLLGGAGPFQAQVPDPREIVRKAAAAIGNLKAIEYDAVYSGHGAVANYPAYSGHVALERISTPFGSRALVSVTGEGYYPGDAAARVYAHTYDGAKVRWLDHNSRALTEREIPSDELNDKTWGELTGHLGRAGASTILWELLSENPFQRALESAHLEYQGAIAVAGELCHIIYQEETHPATNRLQRQQWYISGADFLPRRHESLSDRDGRIGVLTLTMSGVKSSDRLGAGTFDLEPPEGYSIASFQASERKAEVLATGSAAPVWTARDSRGMTLGLSGLEGKVTVLDFWAEWCVPCKEAMPVLQRLHDKYSARGVTVIGIHCFPAKGGKPPMDYIRLKEYTYLQITSGDEIAEDYGVSSLPTLYVIDQSGKIAFQHIGFNQNLESDLTRIIDSLIDKD